MDPLLIGAAFLLLGDKGGGGGGGKGGSSSTAPATDGVVLAARAATGAKWRAVFISQDQPPIVADALARWAGIESGGNPLNASKLGERGLFQCLQSTALQANGPYTAADWSALGDKRTTGETHAALAIKLYRWCWTRASKYVSNPPTNAIDKVWYAKLYHQRPTMVSTAKMHGPAIPMARSMAMTWKGTDFKMHYLRAANVVAFGTYKP